ncbi:MAG: hypothetical protein AABZ06_00935 [Bdellovibrionota bacterium]
MLEEKYTALDLVKTINSSVADIKASTTFLNECAADPAYLYNPPVGGRGLQKVYNDCHLFEFALLCHLKIYKVERLPSKNIIKALREDTQYHKAESLDEMKKRVGKMILVIKNRKHLQTANSFERVMEILKGHVGRFKNKSQQDAWGTATSALIFNVEEVVSTLY